VVALTWARAERVNRELLEFLGKGNESASGKEATVITLKINGKSH